MNIQGEVCPINVPEERRYLLDQASEAMKRGWKLVALMGKKPLGNDWPNRPITSDKLLLKHIAAGRNLGLLTGTASGVLVLDVDLHKGAQVPDNIPIGPAVLTGGGGLHLYFRMPPNVILRNAVRLPYAGIDVRASGGQVVYPGSIHPDSGEMYDWLPGRSPSEVALPDLPPEVLMHLPVEQQSEVVLPRRRGHHYYDAALRREIARVANSSEGTRNSNLNLAAFKLAKYVGEGMLANVAVEEALRDAARQCGLCSSEVLPTIHSAFAGANKKRHFMNRVAAADSPIEEGSVSKLQKVERERGAAFAFPPSGLVQSPAWRSLTPAQQAVGWEFLLKHHCNVCAGGDVRDPIPFTYSNVDINANRGSLSGYRNALVSHGIIECVGNSESGLYRYSEEWMAYRLTEREMEDAKKRSLKRNDYREDGKRARKGYSRAACINGRKQNAQSGAHSVDVNGGLDSNTSSCDDLEIEPESGVATMRTRSFGDSMTEIPAPAPEIPAGSLPTMGGNGRHGREGLTDEFVEDAGPP